MLKYLRSQDGASSAEYAMLLGMVGGFVAIAIFIFGGAVAERMSSATDMVASGGDPTAASTSTSGGGRGRGRGAAASAAGGANGAANANGGNGLGGGGGGGQ